MADAFFNFRWFFGVLEDIGIMDVLLPFLLIFVVVFAILQKTKILGKEASGKQFNVVVALVVALSVVIPHVTGSYPLNFDVVNIINMVLPQVSLLIVALLMFLILVGIFGGAKIPGMVAFISFLLILFIFLGTTEWLYGLDWLYDFFGTEAVSILIFVIVFGLIIWFITSQPKGEQTGEKIKNWISDLLGGGA